MIRSLLDMLEVMILRKLKKRVFNELNLKALQVEIEVLIPLYN